MSAEVGIFKDEDGDNLKNKNNELMRFCIDDEKLLKKYSIIYNKIEVMKNIELNALLYDNKYIKTKTRTYGDKIYSNFRGLSVLCYNKLI